MVSMETTPVVIAEVGELMKAVAAKFDTTDTDAERDFLAAHCPSRLESVLRELPTLGIHLLDHLTDTPTNVVALAARSGQLKGTVSKHVQRLVDAGLVQRSPVPGNRREIALSLTGDGRVVARAHRRMHDEMNRGLADFLSRYSRGELHTVVKILRDLLVAERIGVRLTP